MLSSRSFPSALLSSTILFLTFLPLTNGINYTDFCSNQNKDLDYGSFHPWPNSILTTIGGPPNSNQACWYYADCIFTLIQDTRKQQFAATSLVMGLIPLILKDVAWPQRRIAYIPHLQPWYIEILVRALGLNPVVKNKPIPYGRTFTKLQSRAIFLLLLFALVSTYGALAIVELFSKHSALGCPYPTFIITWFIVALLPSSLEVGASRYRNRNEPSSGAAENEGVTFVDNTEAIEMEVTASEGIQGSQEALFVQFSWAVYYTAGTLVFSSIMLVTVLELFVWVMATCMATAVSKMFAYKLCGYWGLGF